METTMDGLLNRRVMLEQPKDGYRVAVDTVLLAAAVPASGGEQVLDIGCGVGGAMLCLASRVPGLSIVGLEIQDDLLSLCRSNIERNNFNHIMRAEKGDATNLPAKWHGRFNHVMMNPPYHDSDCHGASPNEIKRIANTEVDGDIAKWIASAAQALVEGGRITIIHRADRVDEITKILGEKFGCIEIKPIVSKSGAAAKRVLIRAAVGKSFSVRSCSPLIMHGGETKYTDEAERILRHVSAVDFE